MDTFYLDFHNGENITIDDDGVELAGIEAARELALRILGQTF